jgi:hypothetical protein
MDPVLQLTTARDGYIAALVADSANPRVDYNIDGQSVSRSAWRENVTRMLKEIDLLIQQYQPTEIQTVAI